MALYACTHILYYWLKLLFVVVVEMHIYKLDKTD